jgi:hypothetical protein
MKLAKLALVQESMKGFPQGIPAVAMPYVIANEINPEELFETQGQEEQPDADMGVSRYGGNMVSQFNTKAYGGVQYNQDGLPMGQDGFWSKVGQGALAALEFPQKTMMWGITGTAGALTGKGWTGEYEMPSETLNRNFPGHPGLAFAADLLADPFMVSGIVKGVARAGLRKVIAKETADFAIKNQAQNLTKYEATMAVLRNVAAKKAAKLKNVKNGLVDADAAANKLFTELKTSTNAERVIKALNTSEKVMKSKKFNNLDNIADQANLVQKRLIKSTGRVAQKQAAVTAAKLPITGAIAIGKGIAEAAPPVARVVKEVAKITAEIGEKVGQKVKDLNTPNVTPFIIPTIQTGEKVSAAIKYSKNNEDENQNLSVLKPKPKKPVVTEPATFVRTGTISPEGYGLFIHPSHPGKKFVFSHGSYITYNPTGTPQGPPKPIVQMNTESDASWIKRVQDIEIKKNKPNKQDITEMSNEALEALLNQK